MTEEMAKVDLNQADLETLTTLPGIGTTLAARIIEYRETVHPFEEVIELAAVPGISERMVRAFEDRAVVSGVPAEIGDETPTEELALISGTTLEPEDKGEPGVAPEMTTEELASAEPSQESETIAEEAAPEVVIPEEAAGLAEAPPPPPMLADELGRREASEPAEERPPSRPQDADWERRAQRRGCFAAILGAALGAIVGAALTLAILAALNEGTLSFIQADNRLQRGLDIAGQGQADLNERLESLGSDLQGITSRTDDLGQRQAEAAAEVTELLQRLETLQQDIRTLDDKTVELDERISRVAAAAETFNIFLDRLRDLLIDLQGVPPTPMPTISPPLSESTPSTTPTAGAAEESGITPTAGAPESGVPTRTPRPTATPFVLPTGTPEPQP